jgi:hypothetical protein
MVLTDTDILLPIYELVINNPYLNSIHDGNNSCNLTIYSSLTLATIAAAAIERYVSSPCD